MSTRKLIKALKNQKDKTQQTISEIYGTLGIPIDGQKLVNVPERSNYVYVRLRDNQNEVVQAFNNTVAISYDLPVIINREGNRYTVMGLNTARYQNTWNVVAPYLPNHGNSHSFSDSGGGDVTWIFPRQFMPGLTYPTSVTTGTNLQVAGFNLYNQGVWKYVGNTGTPSPIPYLPTGSSIMALLYMDALTGNPDWLVGSGSYLPSMTTGSSSVTPYIPAVVDPARQIPLAGVRLTPMSTGSISWDNIYDVRQWIHTSPTGTSASGGAGGLGFVGKNQGVYLATGTILNVNGTRLVMSVSGTTFNLTNSPDPQELIGIYGLSGTTALGTGTSISFGNYLLSSITGTTLYVRVSAGTGTSQVATGDRGVTNGDDHNHVGGDGAVIIVPLMLGTHGNSATVPASTTHYIAPNTPIALSTIQNNTLATLAGTLKKFYVRTGTAQPGTGTLVCTVMINNAASAITFTIAAGAAAGTYSDLVNTAAISSGDFINFRLVNNATAVSATIGACVVQFDVNSQ